MEKVAVANFFFNFHPGPYLNVNEEFSGEQTKLILQYCSFAQLLLLMSVLNGHCTTFYGNCVRKIYLFCTSTSTDVLTDLRLTPFIGISR